MLAYSPIALGGAIAGMGLVCVSALVLGPPGSTLTELDRLQDRLVSIRSSAALAKASATLTPSSFSLFGQNVSIAVALQGISISPIRRAALVSIGGAEPDWLDLGQTRDGVTLVDVQPSKITVDTDGGTKEVQFAQGASAPAPTDARGPGRPQAAAPAFNAALPNRLGPAVPMPSQLGSSAIQSRGGTASNFAHPFSARGAAGNWSGRPQAGVPNAPSVQFPVASRAPG